MRLSLSTLVLVFGLAAACGGGGGGSGGGGGGGGGGGDDEGIDPGLVPDLGPSEFQVLPAFGTPADGTSSVTIELRLISLLGHPISGAMVELEISGCGNVWQPLPPTDVEGRTRGTLASFAGERKSITARTESGGRLTEFAPRGVEFLLIPEHTYFVRATGSDLESGTSPRAAWATLQHALQNVGPGATLHVGAGTYSGPLELALDSSATRPFVLAGDGTGTMTGDPGAVVIEAGGGEHALRVSASAHLVVQGLVLRGAHAGISIEGSRDVRVLACLPQENDHGLVIEGSSAVTVQDCRISANRLAAVHFGATADLRFENNLVYANLGEGLALRAGVQDALLRFNTFYRNGGNHLSEEEPGGTGIIEENILAEGGAEAFQLVTASGYQARVNLTWGNVVRGPSRDPNGNVEADPLFADPFGADGILGGPGSADDDFRLLPESAAIDLGTHLARAIVLGSRESLATRTTRVDDRLEWSGDDLPATNLGFHAPLPVPPFASVPKAGARFVHAVPGDVRAHARAWELQRASETRTLDGPLLEAEVVFLEQRLSPLETREELLGAQVNTGSAGRILVRRWDGRRWDEPALSPLVDDIALEGLVDQRFDLEYEALSGRALLVWADGDGVPSLRVLERGSWSTVQDAGTTAVGAGRVRWVELVPRRGSNEIALVTLDDMRDLVVTLWDGARFGEPLLLERNTLYRPSWRPFDAAFESLSGDLLVTWGFSVYAEEARWATLERATGQWRLGQLANADAVGAEIVLAADPVTNRIAATFGEGDLDNDVTVSVWDGAQWNDTAELTLAGPYDNRLLELAWIGNSGVACAVFRRQGHTGSFNVALLLPAGWRIQPDVVLNGARGSADKATQVVLRSFPGQNQLLGLVLDQGGRLFALRYDAQRFTLLDGGLPLATGLDPAAPGRPFDLALPAAGGVAPFLK